IPVYIFFNDPFIVFVDIYHLRKRNADSLQTVVISNLCLDLVSKLVIVTGLMVDLFEYHSTSFPLSEIRIAAFSPAEKFQDAIVFSIYREYLRHLFLISVFLTHNSIHPLAPIMPDTASDVTGFHRNIS